MTSVTTSLTLGSRILSPWLHNELMLDSFMSQISLAFLTMPFGVCFSLTSTPNLFKTGLMPISSSASFMFEKNEQKPFECASSTSWRRSSCHSVADGWFAQPSKGRLRLSAVASSHWSVSTGGNIPVFGMLWVKPNGAPVLNQFDSSSESGSLLSIPHALIISGLIGVFAFAVLGGNFTDPSGLSETTNSLSFWIRHGSMGSAGFPARMLSTSLVTDGWSNAPTSSCLMVRPASLLPGILAIDSAGFRIPPMALLFSTSLSLAAWSKSSGPRAASLLHFLASSSDGSQALSLKAWSIASAIALFKAGGYSPSAFDARSLFPEAPSLHLWTRDSWAARYVEPSGRFHSFFSWSHLLLAMWPNSRYSLRRMVGFTVSAPKVHWSNFALSVIADPPRRLNQLVFQISSFSLWSGFSIQKALLALLTASATSSVKLIRVFASFSCLASSLVSLAAGRPSGCSKDLRSLGPGGFSRSGDTVSQGLAMPTTSKTLSLMSRMILDLTVASKRSVEFGPSKSTTTTIHLSLCK